MKDSTGYGLRRINKNFVSCLKERATDFAESYWRSPLTATQIMFYIVEMYALVHYKNLKTLLETGDLTKQLPGKTDTDKLLKYAEDL